MPQPETQRRATPTTGHSDASPSTACGPGALYETLYFADSWFQVVRVLHAELGLTKAEIARATGVTTVTVTRWLEANDQDVRTPAGLDDLRFVVLTMLMDGAMTPRLLRFWLSARDVQLGTDALTAISDGRFEEVVDAGRALTRLRRPDGAGSGVHRAY